MLTRTGLTRTRARTRPSRTRTRISITGSKRSRMSTQNANRCRHEFFCYRISIFFDKGPFTPKILIVGGILGAHFRCALQPSEPCLLGLQQIWALHLKVKSSDFFIRPTVTGVQSCPLFLAKLRHISSAATTSSGYRLYINWRLGRSNGGAEQVRMTSACFLTLTHT